MSRYTDQIRALADRLQEGKDIPLAAIVTLREAAEKIDDLGEMLENEKEYIKRILENKNVAF